MDIKNAKAIKTLIRNKLGSNNNWDTTHYWFHEKGITVDIQNEYYFLNSDKIRASELSEFCNSIIYKKNELMCFHGSIIEKSTLEKTKNNSKFIWNENTIFIENLSGKSVYMFWDKFLEKWVFSDNNKVNSPFKNIIEKNIYNIMTLDPIFTYCFKVVSSGKSTGIYLETMYNNNSCKELNWEEVYKISQRINVKHPDIYEFQGFDKLEEGDFPVLVRDISKNTILLERIR